MRNPILVSVVISPLIMLGCDSDSGNPFYEASTLQYQAADFNKIEDQHFMPAFKAGIKSHLQEVEGIANNKESATFQNTLEALEKSGLLLDRVSSVFYNLAGSDSNTRRAEIEQEMAPILAAHYDDIYLNSKLFARVKTIYTQRNNSGLDAESIRLTEYYHKNMVRAGAQLDEQKQLRIRDLNKEHSTLTSKFSQNLLHATKYNSVVVEDKNELDGLSADAIKAASENADNAGHKGKYLLQITNTTRQPVLSMLKNRNLRQRVWEASAYRATEGENSNVEIVKRLVQIRAEKATILGYENWASYNLDSQMAQTPEKVLDLIGSMVPAVVANAQQELADIQDVIDKSGSNFTTQPWDWEFYAEKVRQARYDVDENAVNQYFEINRVLQDGVFYTLERFYGVTFKPRTDLPVYHEDVQAYELFDADGTSLAIFYADYFTREGKRGGAWMNSFVTQSRLLNRKPVIVNVANFNKAAKGEPTLLSFDNVVTMFHEIGHAVHGMLSNVKYPSLAGTAVSRDFVEFPSTFKEDWAYYPDVIRNYAKHYRTGEPISPKLLDKVISSRGFNQGYDTLEYIAAALLDMEWHLLSPGTKVDDINEFEVQALKKHGVYLPAIPPRYKSAFFSHSMGGGYSSSYYAYLWSEILAADAFAYIQSKGGLKRENGKLYRTKILQVGNSKPLMESYKDFRGQLPTTEALLIRRGLEPNL